MRIALERKEKFVCAAHVAIATLEPSQTLHAYFKVSGYNSLEDLVVRLEDAIVER